MMPGMLMPAVPVTAAVSARGWQEAGSILHSVHRCGLCSFPPVYLPWSLAALLTFRSSPATHSAGLVSPHPQWDEGTVLSLLLLLMIHPTP